MHFVRSIALTAITLLVAGHFTTAAGAEPSSTGKGIVGGTLLGAELVLATEAAIDVSPNWLYYVGGGVGAVGGGVGGYFLEDRLSAKSNMLLLAAGMLLAIPTTVAVLSATSYEQTEEYTQDKAPTDEPTADAMISAPTSPATGTPGSSPPSGEGASAPPTTAPVPSAAPAPSSAPQSHHRARRPRLPQALVAMDDQANLHLGLPAVEVRDMYSRVEIAKFGEKQRQELRVPLLRVAF